MSITERFRRVEVPAMASTLPSASTGALQPLHDGMIRPLIVATLAGSTTERAAEVAQLVDEALRIRAAQAESGRRSAAAKAAAYSAKIDAALATVLRSLNRDGPQNTLPCTPDVILKKMANVGLGRLGLSQRPGKAAIRDGLKRRLHGTVASPRDFTVQAIPSDGAQGHDASSPST